MFNSSNVTELVPKANLINVSVAVATPRFFSLSPPSAPPTEKLLPDAIDFVVYGNVTANVAITAVVKALDGGPNSISGETTAALALSTPFIVFICLMFMLRCQRRYCCGGRCFYYWFHCTGCCKQACGGEDLLSGTQPATGLQPDEEVDDPEYILGDEEGDVDRDPPVSSDMVDVPLPESTASEMSEDEEDGDTESSYAKDCRKCCNTVATCLENGDATGVELTSSNGHGSVPATKAARKAKQHGRGKKK